MPSGSELMNDSDDMTMAVEMPHGPQWQVTTTCHHQPLERKRKEWMPLRQTTMQL